MRSAAIPAVAEFRRNAELLRKDLRSQDAVRAQRAAEAVRILPMFRDLAADGEWFAAADKVLEHRERFTHSAALSFAAFEAGYDSWAALVKDGAARPLVDEAWEHFERGEDAEAWRKAGEALVGDPNAADAYAVQALTLCDRECYPGAEILYRRGLEAAQRTLGLEPGVHAPSELDWWVDLETRPYMRCVSGLAFSVYQQGRVSEAVDWYRQMLVLNPADHQGARYDLVQALLQLRRFRDVASAIRTYFPKPNRDAESFTTWIRLCLETARGRDPMPVARSIVAREPFACHVLLQAVHSRAVLWGATARRLLPAYVTKRNDAARALLIVAPSLSTTPAAIHAVERAFREAVARDLPMWRGDAEAPGWLHHPAERIVGGQQAPYRADQEYRSLLRQLRSAGLVCLGAMHSR